MTSVTSVTVLGSQMFFRVSLNPPPPRLPFELTVKLRDPSSNLCSTTGHLLFTSVELKRSRAELRVIQRREDEARWASERCHRTAPTGQGMRWTHHPTIFFTLYCCPMYLLLLSPIFTLNTTNTVPCTVFFAGQLLSKERQWRRRSRNASSLRLATLSLWIWHQAGNQWVGLELLAYNWQIYRH